jgi:AcrR family transcriptional regulator
MASGLTERTRERTRREIADAAGQLFIEKGYAATTVKDIAEAADVSSRTFFRYFPSKEDVVTALASSTMDTTLDLLSQHDKGDSLLSALKVVLHATLERVAEDPEPARKFQFLLRDTPELRGRWLEEQRRNRDRLAAALAPWFTKRSNPMAAQLAAGAALLALDVAVLEWANHDSSADPTRLLDQALGVIGSDQLFLMKR